MHTKELKPMSVRGILYIRSLSADISSFHSLFSLHLEEAIS
jgi:hypothetical protein